MNFCFENATCVYHGLTEVASELGITLTDASDADICVYVREQKEDGYRVTLDERKAEITYGGGASRFFRALALLADWERTGETHRVFGERTLFLRNGPMLDVSRNAVLNVKTLKFMLRKIALMGMSTCMLYTEDTYTVDGYPYFGYMRGRYTKEELRELDAYALALGLELIPCIQVLGHLRTALRWEEPAPYRDTPAVLLVGEERTYCLIDEMMKTLEQCFTTRRVHIGMDETGDIGTGTSLRRNGYRPQHELYLEHLARVVEIVHAHGFSPMMWSDMFFRLSANGLAGYEDYDMRVTVSDEIAALIPKGVTQVYWDYYHEDEAFYAKNIESHRKLGKDTIFAGGVWLWSGHAPLFDRSLRNTVPALDACRKGGIEEVLATVWLNGGEGQLILSLAGLAWYADYGYRGEYDEESVKCCFRRACLAEYDAFMATMRVEYPHGGEYSFSRALLYNDPLMGMMDAHIAGLDTNAYYRGVMAELEVIRVPEIYASAFGTIRALSSLLADKSDFGVRLKSAYDAGNRDNLAALSEECVRIGEKLETLRCVHRAAWMTYCKPHGWEVMDLRYGGMKARIETAKARIDAYLAGEIDAIEELEEERLRFDCLTGAQTRDSERFHWYRFSQICTAGVN